MNNRVVYNLHYAFHEMGFTVLRFNFRGVGRSQGEYDQGVGELSDAASALDYLQSMNPNAKHCWVAGFSFGAWIGMQLLMRRPEITGFISVSPPANMYDFLVPRALPLLGPDHQRQVDELMEECEDYLDRRLAGELVPETAAKRLR
jgi:alpha/beta superfamily hydrolase